MRSPSHLTNYDTLYTEYHTWRVRAERYERSIAKGYSHHPTEAGAAYARNTDRTGLAHCIDQRDRYKAKLDAAQAARNFN